ncbi:MAG: PepSY-like domain-containing protein [Bacteroidota bacterium]
MKKIILFLLNSALFVACSNSGNPPEKVIKSFTAKFPDATSIKWGKENATEWEAEFTLNGSKISANFTADGAWVETEQVILISQLPKAVTDAIQKQYPNWKITEADKTETAKHGTIYEADIKSGTQKKALAFKEDGSTVKE